MMPLMPFDDVIMIIRCYEFNFPSFLLHVSTAILMTPELQSAVSLAENAIRLGWLKGDFDEATFNAFRQIIERGTEEVITTKFVLTDYFQLCL